MPKVTQSAGTLWRPKAKAPILNHSVLSSCLYWPRLSRWASSCRRFPFYSPDGLREGHGGPPSLGFQSYHHPGAQGNWTSSVEKDLNSPWKGLMDEDRKGECCQLRWPLAGRTITLLLLLNFTTWAVVLMMRLVLGCPINLAFGGFPRWGGRSYHQSVERGVVCNLQWEEQPP